MGSTESEYKLVTKLYEGVHGFRVIVIGNEFGKPSSNPGRGCLHFTSY